MTREPGDRTTLAVVLIVGSVLLLSAADAVVKAVTIVREIKASPAKVWEAITPPELIIKW